MHFKIGSGILALLLVVQVCGAQPAETFESLARRLPADANAIVLMDVEQVLAAPLAKQQGWGAKLEAAYAERPVFLPPEAKKLVLGAALQPNNDFIGRWELAIMELAAPVAVRSIAKNESGYVDDVNGVPAAITPLNAAFVDLGNSILAVMRPADRQLLSRWIARQKQGYPSGLSDYLRSAVPLVNDRVQVLLAVDLTDVLSAHGIDQRIAKADWIKEKHADAATIAAVAATLRGATLRLAIGDKCQAQLKIDFDADVAPLGNSAMPLVTNALTNLGFPADEISKWEIQLAGRSIRLQGSLSNDAQRRVFSVIELPSTDLNSAVASPGESAAKSSEEQTRDRSLAYFKSTQTLVADLRKSLKDSQAATAWMARYARRIAEPPILHVDEQLLEYGDKLAETLRVMSLSQRQAGIRAGVRASEGRGYYSDGYGTKAYDAAAQRSQATKEEMSVAYDTRVQGWKLIDDATADIRRSMTKKFGVEF
jgi:hypothetical protein